MKSQKWSAVHIFSGIVLLVMLAAAISAAQSLDPAQWRPLRWRSVGPQRGGRALAVAGVAGNEDVYYFGAVACVLHRRAGRGALGSQCELCRHG